MSRANGAYDRDTSAYLESIFESSPLALVSLDLRLRVTMCNRATTELTGWDAPSLLGRRVTRLIALSRLRPVIEYLRARGTLRLGGWITKLTGSDGKEVPVRLRLSPLAGEGGRPIGTLLLASDLRDAKRAQARLIEAERVEAIAQTAVSINHEINNPLCSILGNTQLLLMEGDKLDPRMIAKLHAIERQIGRIQLIAERLARVTRPVVREYVGGRTMIDLEESGVESIRPGQAAKSD
ncbi:MAG: PAS domain S-box protein [Candidatus Krumholzibacteriota bacterium]|nr:PAS domain S-box protein [Candidatus Krumholzibacteriota bacterium]